MGRLLFMFMWGLSVYLYTEGFNGQSLLIFLASFVIPIADGVIKSKSKAQK